MRRMEKEFNKIFTRYQKELEKLGELDTEQTEDPKSWARDTIAKYCDLNLDFEKLCLMGLVEITMYYDGTFGLSKECVPFFVNDLVSLQGVMKYFYGTPFELHFRKINKLDFVRYEVSIPEIKANNFRKLEIYIEQMNISLHEIDKHCHYD